MNRPELLLQSCILSTSFFVRAARAGLVGSLLVFGHSIYSAESDKCLTAVHRDYVLKNADGEHVRFEKYVGHPTVVVCVLGSACHHCNEQLAAMADIERELTAYQINVVVISSSTSDSDSDLPFDVYTDPTAEWFKQLGCFSGKPEHGTFLLDAEGAVKWRNVADTPFMNLGLVYRLALDLRTLN